MRLALHIALSMQIGLPLHGHCHFFSAAMRWLDNSGIPRRAKKKTQDPTSIYRWHICGLAMLAHRYLHHVDICLICLPFADMFLFIYSFMLCKRASAQDCNFLRAPRAKELIRTHGRSRLHYLQQMDLVPKFLCSWHQGRMSSSMLWRAQNMLRLVPCWPHVRL